MKKYSISLFIILALIFLIPSVVSASWWNPLSWGYNWHIFGGLQKQQDGIKNEDGQVTLPNVSTSTPMSETVTHLDNPAPTVGGRLRKKVQESIQASTTTSRFYIKYDNSRLRSCASTAGCDVLGYYPKNQEINLSGLKTLSDLEEWVPITTRDGVNGFLNKSVLSETPVAITKTTEDPFIFYIKNNDTPVYSCPSITCDITGYYMVGNRTKNYDKISMNNLPEWVKIAEGDGSIGYVYKTEVSDKIVKVESSTKPSQAITHEDLKGYKDELHKLTGSLHNEILSIKAIISIEITFANNVSNTIESDQTSSSKSLTYFTEKVIPSRVDYLNASVNLLDSIDRHVTKIENLIDLAEYTVVLDVYHKSLITDQEDILKIDKEIKTSSDKFSGTVTQVGKSSVKTNSSINKSSPSQNSINNSNPEDLITSIKTPIIIGVNDSTVDGHWIVFGSILTNYVLKRTPNDPSGIRSSCTNPNGEEFLIPNRLDTPERVLADIGGATTKGTYRCRFSIDETSIRSPDLTIEVP